jgi:hypothetical protein
MSKRLLILKANTAQAMHRKEILDGRSYLVVPTVMLVEGVFVANEGPLYYNPDDYGDQAPSWNNKPIVVYHPQDDEGNFISASDPSVLQSSRVGFILNAHLDDQKRLVAEAWIDEAKADEVDKRITSFILNGKPMNVSTGMFSDILEEEGTWGGTAYVGRSLNHRPDHFALLPDQKGACSLKDGAGLLVMQDGTPPDPELQKNVKIRLDSMIANQLSHEDLRDALRKHLRVMLILNGSESYPWIADVYQDYFIAEIDSRLWKISFSVADNSVTIKDSPKPVEVVRVTEYKTVDGKLVVNQLPEPSDGETNVKKTEMITALIANGGFEDSDKELLEGMTEEKLGKLVAKIAPAKIVANEKADPIPAPAAMTWEQFMGTAPPQFRQVISRGVAVLNQQIARDIEEILKDGSDLYTKEELTAMDPDFLSKTAKLVANMRAKAAPAPAGDADDDTPELPAYYGGSVGTFPAHFVANSGEVAAEPLDILTSY